MFFNTKGIKGKISTAAENFLKFVESNEANDDFTERLRKKVENIKKSKEWRIEYMTLMMRDREKLKEGIELGAARERAVWEAKESTWILERTALEDKNSALENEKAALENEKAAYTKREAELLKKIEELEKSRE